MKTITLTVAGLFLAFNAIIAQTAAPDTSKYKPAAENVQARQQFQADKYGMFIHWGLSSMLADGEWVMNNRNIKVVDYSRLLHAFNPADFNAAQWVATAKNATIARLVRGSEIEIAHRPRMIAI